MRFFPIALISIFVLAACSSLSGQRGPAADKSRTHLSKTGEACKLNLDGDTDPDTIEIAMISGKRVAQVTHANGKKAKPLWVEPLSRQTGIECVSNLEPGIQMQGTDDTQKAVGVSLIHDYFKVGKADAGAKLMYFDKSSKSYKWIWQAD